jgi:aspartate aminotransferase
MSTYSSVPLAPPDAIFHLAASCKADPDNSKINLGIGAYRDGTYLLTEDNGNPWVLPVVKKAELLIVNDASLDHEYLSIDGLSSFTTASIKLMLGEKCPLILNKCVASAQTVSGKFIVLVFVAICVST